MADQKVEIVDYDPGWPLAFATEANRVAAVLGSRLAAAVEHIGSTAVPGLRAKPIVDLLAPVDSLADREAMIATLSGAGWIYDPDDPNGAWRLWFLRPRPEARTHHLMVIAADDPHAAALLAFRDALRADPELRRAYAELKQELSERHAANRNAYTNAKADFIAAALRRAGIEPPRTSALAE